MLVENPPSTAMLCPVTKSDAFEAKKNAHPAKSSGYPKPLFPGVFFFSIAFPTIGCSIAGFAKSVRIHPGMIQFA